MMSEAKSNEDETYDNFDPSKDQYDWTASSANKWKEWDSASEFTTESYTFSQFQVCTNIDLAKLCHKYPFSS